MELNEYQFKANKTNIYPNGKLGVLAISLALNEEAGEVASLFQKHIRDGGVFSNNALVKELGDVLWQLSQLASRIGWDLESVADVNLQKLQSRQERGKITGGGDDR